MKIHIIIDFCELIVGYWRASDWSPAGLDFPQGFHSESSWHSQVKGGTRAMVEHLVFILSISYIKDIEYPPSHN